MAKQTHGLGKGLGALLGDTDPAQFRKPVGYINKDVVKTAAEPARISGDIVRIPVDLIEPNPYQPRMTFDNEALAELADSIRTLGLIQPITVRRKGSDRFQIISGERRFRASRLAGLEMIPAYVLETNDQGMLEMAIVENIQRENLDPIETALSFQRLIDECNLTQEAMADRVGKKRASVTNYLRMLRLPAEIQMAIKSGAISMGHAKVLLSVPDELIQVQLCQKTVEEDLSVRALEEKVKRLAKPARPVADEPESLSEECYRALEIVGKYFDNNISFKKGAKGSGSMTIRFKDDKQMARFIKALEEGNI